jgi:hypothetical protein
MSARGEAESIVKSAPVLPRPLGVRSSYFRVAAAQRREQGRPDIGAPHATDQTFVERTDEITALLLGALGRAIAERRHTWLLHYSWFVDLVNELLDDVPGKPWTADPVT